MAKRDIDFLFEIGSLRKVPRAWQQVLTGKVQNISEHTFRTAMIAWIIAAAEKADTSKVVKIALIHDLAESRTGDIAFLHREYTFRNEEAAAEHIFHDTVLDKEARELLVEYEERKTLEAKIVKDADNLDIDLELKELSTVGDTSALAIQKNHRPKIKTKIYTKTGKKMWDDIQKTNPNTWHEVVTKNWVKNPKAGK